MEQNDRAEKDVISLLDEEGKEHEFEIVDALELDNRQYLALVPLYDETQAAEALEDSGELVILRVSDEEDEDGNPTGSSVDFGFTYPPTVKIAGTVWVDADGDGVCDNAASGACPRAGAGYGRGCGRGRSW